MAERRVSTASADAGAGPAGTGAPAGGAAAFQGDAAASEGIAAGAEEAAAALDPDTAALVRRLKRIEGQARGLQRMILSGRRCEEIVIQLAALKEAVNTVGMHVLGKHLERCMREELARRGSGRQAIAEALQILQKLS